MRHKCHVMKRFAYAAVAVAAMVAAGCGRTVNTAPAQEGSGIDYSASFFRNVISGADEGENVFVSPYSAGVALSMLAEGAEGRTREELAQALNGVTFTSAEVAADSSVDIRSANSAWIRDGFKVKEAYLEELSGTFNARVENLDFSDPASVGIINAWCSENTMGRIPEIIGQISPDMVMFLMNALYFKAPWEKAFDPAMTSDATFYGYTRESKVPFMTLKSKFRYAEYMGSQLICLPYKGGKYSMLVLLPARDVSPDAVLPYLDDGSYRKALDSMEETEVSYRMPKFRMETTTVLNSALSGMGAKRVFTPSAELGGIASGRIAVDEVKQKCFVEVNEEGSEAAAVTSIGIRLTSANIGPVPVSMTVDRPFLFAIADIENDNILFIGRVMNL